MEAIKRAAREALKTIDESILVLQARRRDLELELDALENGDGAQDGEDPGVSTFIDPYTGKIRDLNGRPKENARTGGPGR